MEVEKKEIPRHRQLYEILRKHIINGVYQEGYLLPSESELCAVHNVTRPTVRQALASLVNDGYIKKQQGKGSVVQKLPQGIGILSIEGTSHSFDHRNLKTNVIVKPYIRPWPEDFPYPLRPEEKESGCIHMERIRTVDDFVILYEITNIPNINMPRFCTRNFENKSLFDTLRKYYQIEITGGDQKLWAIPSDKKLSEYLQIEEGSPILQLHRRINTNRHDFSFYSFVFCNTSKYYLHGVF